VELGISSVKAEAGTPPEGWQTRTLGSLLSLQNGVNAAKAAYGTGTPFINVLEVITKPRLSVASIPGRVAVAPHVVDVFAVRAGDVLFNRTSETQEEVGLASVYTGTETVLFGGFVIRGRPRTELLDPGFASYSLRSPTIRRQIVARGQGAVRANIGQRELSRVQVVLPTRAEQVVIAKALSDADALIESLEQLLAKKRHLRQGAMQELLTGKKRLPGFAVSKGAWQTEMGRIPEDWGMSTVGTEFSIQLGKMLDAEKNVGMPRPFLGNRAVQWGKIDLTDIGEVRLTPSDIQRFRLRHGDLLVCEGGEVGRAAMWRESIEECYYQKALHRLRPSRSYNVEFMLHLLHRLAATGFLTNFVTQTSIAHLPKDKFETVPIPLPSRAEQDAITGVLSDMDAETAALEAKLTKARQIKEGMMQELLTGRIRLV